MKKKITPEYDLIEVNSNLRGLLKERPKKKTYGKSTDHSKLIIFILSTKSNSQERQWLINNYYYIHQCRLKISRDLVNKNCVHRSTCIKIKLQYRQKKANDTDRRCIPFI